MKHGSIPPEMARPTRRMCVLACLTAMLAGCGDAASPVTTGGVPVSMTASGNAQITSIGTELPSPLVVRVTTLRGRPLRGLPLTWATPDDGSIIADRLVTDDSGLARATWILGSRSGEHSATALVDGHEIHFRATAAAPIPLGAVPTLTLRTFDGSGELVHPDVVRVPRGWAGARRFLAITPYPGGNANKELPSIYASGDLAEWEPPDGLTNPVAHAASRSYLSDPDIVFDPDSRQLWLYYRQVTKQNTIFRITSPNGTQWSQPVEVLSVPNHMAVSPSIVRLAAGNWHMWTVNAGTNGCSSESTVVEHRTSSDGIRWSTPESVQLGDAELSPWHLDVTWIPEFQQYWALYNGKPPGSCSTPAIFLATSDDGIHWSTGPTPILARGAIPEFRDIVYRSTLEYDRRSDVVTLWYSGARWYEASETWVWRAAVQRLRRDDLFAMSRATGPMRRLLEPSATAPPLMRAP